MLTFNWRVTYRSEGPLDVHGAGLGVVLADRSVEVGGEDLPVIPGSSLRGVARTELERLLRSVGRFVCQPPHPDRMCPHVRSGTARPGESGSQGKPVSEAEKQNFAGLTAIGREQLVFCDACRIFGSPWLSSAVWFSELVTAEPVKVATRTSVSVSRWTGSAESERLYSFEFVPAGADRSTLLWVGNVEGRLEEPLAGLLLIALRMVSHLGGQKARGFGRVSLVRIEGHVGPSRPDEPLTEDVSNKLMELGWARLERASAPDAKGGSAHD
ncbi:MAG: hypothetical protein IMX00_08725 [Limnochordales bacterium]|nr:hypothetical protein [Limnochordales bacterium]